MKKAKKNSINIKMQEYNLESYPINKNGDNKLEIQINANLDLIAPVEENTKIGEAIVTYDNHIILNIGILTAEKIKKKSIVDYIFEMGKNYSNYLEQVI